MFNVHTPVLKALRFGAVTREAGKAFHCSRVLGKKLYSRYVFLSRGTRNELECMFLKCLICGLSSLTISTSIRLFQLGYILRSAYHDKVTKNISIPDVERAIRYNCPKQFCVRCIDYFL